MLRHYIAAMNTPSLVKQIVPAKRLAQLPPYFFHGLNARIAELQASGRDVIRMDAGSPDLPPAAHIIAALQQSARNPDHHGYQSYNGTPEYRDAWRRFYQRRFGVELAPNEITLVIGAKEGVFNLSQAILTEAVLESASLIDANLTDAILVQANLIKTNACRANFRGANLRHAEIEKTSFRGATMPDGRLYC